MSTRKKKVQRFNEDNINPELVQFNPAQIKVGRRSMKLTQRFAVNMFERMKSNQMYSGVPVPSTGTDGSDRAAAKDIAQRITELCEASELDWKARFFKISDCNYAIAKVPLDVADDEEEDDEEAEPSNPFEDPDNPLSQVDDDDEPAGEDPFVDANDLGVEEAEVEVVTDEEEVDPFASEFDEA